VPNGDRTGDGIHKSILTELHMKLLKSDCFNLVLTCPTEFKASLAMCPQHHNICKKQKLLLAIQTGVTSNQRQRLQMKSYCVITEREEKRRLRLQKLEYIKHYVKTKSGYTSFCCCKQKMCMHRGCGKISANEQSKFSNGFASNFNK